MILRAATLWLALSGTLAAAQEVQFAFEGNQAVSSADLAAVVEGERARYAGRDFLEAVLDDAAFLLARRYRLAGYRRARVVYEVDEDDPRNVVFRIEEGRVWRYARPLVLHLSGEVPGFADWWLKRSSYSLPKFLAEAPILVEDRLLDEVEVAKEHLREYGYADLGAKIAIVDREDEAVVEVDVWVDLGPRTLLGSVPFTGEILFPPVVLLGEIGLEPWPPDPVPWHDDLSLRHQADLLHFYREKGHFRPAVTLETEEVDVLAPLVRRANLVYRIEPGEVWFVRSIVVEGEEHVAEDVIRSAFVVEPGDRYNVRRIEEGRRALLRLDSFDFVTVAEDEVEGESGRLDLVIRVAEKRLYTLALSLGYSLFEQIRAGARLQVNSLFGTGRGLDLDAYASIKRRRAQLHFVDPLPFEDSANRLEVGPFVERQERESFTLHRVGGELDFSREIGTGLEVDLGWTWEKSDLRHLGRGLARTGEGDEFFSGPRIALQWDRRDDAVNPTSGALFGWTVDSSWRGVAATEDLIGASLRAQFYYPLPIVEGRGIVFYTGYRAAVVQPILGNGRVPIQKRLFLGGEDTVRSFEEDRLGPQNLLDTPLGGELSLMATFELRVQILGELWGVVFADVGTVEERLRDFPRRDIDSGIGFGLRYHTPLGPVRLEIAFNPDRDRSAEEDLFEVVLAVGFRF